MNNTKNLDLNGDEVRVLDKDKFSPSKVRPAEHDDNHHTFVTGETDFIHNARQYDSIGLDGMILRQVIDELEDQIGNYGLIINELLELIGQLAWDTISTSNPLDISSPIPDYALKNRLRDIYPKLSKKKRDHIYRGVNLYLYSIYGTNV